jgi:acetyl-CoA acetyltransferase
MDLSAAAVVGIGRTAFTRRSGRTGLALAAEAVRAALDDCGHLLLDGRSGDAGARGVRRRHR